MPRPRVPLLSADRIADAAIELIDSGDGFGVNALARRLGVTPSSLYNHVDGKDAIVELVRDRLTVRYLAEPPEGDWEDVVVSVMRAQRRMYAAHPLIVPLLVGKTITSDRVIASYDRVATALLEAGFPEDEVLTIVAVLDGFALGFGLDLAGPEVVWLPQQPTRTLGRLVESGPTGAARSDRVFEVGLELLMDSLHVRLARIAGR
ncbi:TetR/AcrR family transcriptional regulator [Agromyces mediolanus]|uniref:TetR/AcrR family transcriptional regulator n=1 Tax=Agromyces mediolanus TaxID=41986 RepID=UPI001E5A7FBF|nr:TetR/AcrR family transcriptional regulator [Agromyces mediolanus]MCD1572886.1 TetR/AcrR family transcriptional regulator [Agromyces mediolanus]